MASPQIENGYTKVANELLEALCCLHLSGNEWSFIHALIRKTYGYNKSEDWITNTQIMFMTGLGKERVSEAKKKLLDKKIVTEKRNKIALNKDYDQWQELRKSVTKVTEKRNLELRKSVTTKEKKRNYTKDTSGEGVDNHQFSNEVGGKVDDMNNHNPLGADIVHAMVAVDPKNKTYYNNKTQRSACDFLLDEYGLDEVKRRIQIVEKTNGTPYFPTITTPVQLRDKWVQLEKALVRYQKETKNNIAFN